MSRNEVPLSIRASSWGSAAGKFSLGFSSPLACALTHSDAFPDCEFFDMDLFDFEPPHETFEDENHDSDGRTDIISSSESICSTNSFEDLYKFSVPSEFLSSTTLNRRNAIKRWKAKKCRQRGVVKVCLARSVVASSRPRVQGRFIRKAEFVSITELQK